VKYESLPQRSGIPGPTDSPLILVYGRCQNANLRQFLSVLPWAFWMMKHLSLVTLFVFMDIGYAMAAGLIGSFISLEGSTITKKDACTPQNCVGPVEVAFEGLDGFDEDEKDELDEGEDIGVEMGEDDFSESSADFAFCASCFLFQLSSLSTFARLAGLCIPRITLVNEPSTRVPS
jgi:hypothetical protein